MRKDGHRPEEDPAAARAPMLHTTSSSTRHNIEGPCGVTAQQAEELRPL
jgi:hypothetical protein